MKNRGRWEIWRGGVSQGTSSLGFLERRRNPHWFGQQKLHLYPANPAISCTIGHKLSIRGERELGGSIMSQINTSVANVAASAQAVGQPRGRQGRQPKKRPAEQPPVETQAEATPDAAAPATGAEAGQSHLDIKG
jgi:hypothetical protein